MGWAENNRFEDYSKKGTDWYYTKGGENIKVDKSNYARLEKQSTQSPGERNYDRVVKRDPKGTIATKYPTYADLETGYKKSKTGKESTTKPSSGGSGTTSTTKSGTTGGFLQDKISSGQMSLGVDKSMPKLDRTISNATSVSHDIISSPKPSGRVGRVKRRQEQRTANLAGRLQERAQKASDKATIDATRTTESGKRQGMRAKAKGPDMPQASSTSAKPSGIDKPTATSPKPTASGSGTAKSSWTFPKGGEYAKLYNTYDPSNTMFKDKADWSANREDAIQQLTPSLRPGGGKEKITLDKTSKANRRGGGTVSQDALVSQTKKEQTQRKVDASFGKEVKGSKSQTSSDWLGAKTYSDVSTMVRRAGGTPSGGSESPKQQTTNDLMDMPVDKDATGGRSGSQFSYGSQAEQDKATHDKYGVTTRGKKVIKVKGFKNK